MKEQANKAAQEIIDELPIECSPRLQREIVGIIDSAICAELSNMQRERDRLESDNVKLVAIVESQKVGIDKARVQLSELQKRSGQAEKRAEAMREECAKIAESYNDHDELETVTKLIAEKIRNSALDAAKETE